MEEMEKAQREGENEVKKEESEVKEGENESAPKEYTNFDELD